MTARVLTLALTTAILSAAPARAEELHVYSSLPLQGVSRDAAADIVRGMRLALSEAGGRAGAFSIRYRSLDDSTAAAGNWEPRRAARNARRAAQDPRTILYLGEFNSGATGISLPILNQGNIPQISPSNTYTGLTVKAPGTRGEPERWYPTGRQTFFRLPPDDRWQARALVAEMQGDGCTRVAVADDREYYGFMIARLTVRAADRAGLKVVEAYGVDKRESAGAATPAVRAKADCVLFAGVTANGAPAFLRAVARRLPAARIYGADGICERAATARLRAYADRFECTNSSLPVAAWPGGPAFAAALGDPDPDGYAIYGYEAMQLGLDTIASLGDRGDRREAVRRALLATRDRASVLGTYSILPSGDSTVRAFGVYRPAPDGAPGFDHVVSGISPARRGRSR